MSTLHVLTARYLALAPGWNLLAGNAFAGRSVSEALSPIKGNYASVWGMTGGGWKMYAPDRLAISDLVTFENGKDYWIFVTEECDLLLP